MTVLMDINRGGLGGSPRATLFDRIGIILTIFILEAILDRGNERAGNDQVPRRRDQRSSEGQCSEIGYDKDGKNRDWNGRCHRLNKGKCENSCHSINIRTDVEKRQVDCQVSTYVVRSGEIRCAQMRKNRALLATNSTSAIALVQVQALWHGSKNMCDSGA